MRKNIYNAYAEWWMKPFIHDKCQAIQAQRQILISAPSFITSSLSGRRAADQRDVVRSLLQGLGMNKIIALPM